MIVRNLFINSIGQKDLPQIDFDDYDNIFIFFRNIFTDKRVIEKSFLELAQDYNEKIGSINYKNIIVIPGEKNNKSRLGDNINYILWFTSKQDSYFNKDNIREKHIWKDVEWGQRKKNYSEKGKDPSNVWIPTLDDGEARITEHIKLNFQQIIDRIYHSTNINGCTDNNYFNQSMSYRVSKEYIISDLEESSEKFLSEFSDIQNTKDFTSKYEFNNKQPSQQKIFFTSSEKMLIENNSVQLVVTSPPYWDLKNYFKKGQIGQESYEEYLSRLGKVWDESIRVLKDDGTIWINLNIRTKNKKVYFIPTDLINQFRDRNMELVDIVIWHKSSSIPVRDNNLTDKYEVFMVFSKNNRIKINIDILKSFNEYKNKEINGHTIWNINRRAGSIGKKMVHPAIFPTELINRIIKLSTDPYDNVLDPFLGSGTTIISTIENSRNGIGIEFNEGFKELIDQRVSKETSNSNYYFEYFF
ncbi:hypothetical protein BOVMAS36_16330 [Streptococcus uberis]